MNRFELRDEDGDRLVVSDFNDDTPESARTMPSPVCEAKLTVHQHTIMDNPATDLSDIAEDGVSVLLKAEDAHLLIAWLLQFFNGVEDVVTIPIAEARAVRHALKNHTVADVSAHMEALASVLNRIEEAENAG